MKDKITDHEQQRRILSRLRKRIKDAMFLFPSNTKTFEILHQMSTDLKAHIKELMKEDDNHE